MQVNLREANSVIINSSNLARQGLTVSPNHIFLDWSKLKAFADNKINVTEKLKFV